jgi:1-acyl-sn-glycerol-3-phosphate acyltransferase
MEKQKSKTALKPKKGWTFLYRLAKALAWVLFHTVYPVTLHNTEHLSLKGPYILICNHLSGLDPVCVAHAVNHEEISFLAKKELMKGRFAGWFLRTVHAIPVDRHNFDIAAMRACTQALREGRVLGIFPEGTRFKKGNMEELEAGVALLALRSSVPVVPMYIHGKLRPFRRIHCYLSAPIPMDDLREKGVGRDAGDALLTRIASLYACLAQKAGS